MRIALALVVLAGCDRLFLTENAFVPPDSTVSCPDAFMGGRYVFIDTSSSWQEAEQSCRALTGGSTVAHLAVVGDRDELMLLDQMRQTREYWVGMSNLTGPFLWITDEPTVMVTELWAPDQPDGRTDSCVRIGSGGLRDSACSGATLFRMLCECDGYAVDETRF